MSILRKILKEMKKILLFASLLLAMVSGVSCKSAKEAEGLKIGFQMYSVRNELEKDFEGTLKKVRDMGYTGVEFYNEYYGRTPAEVRRLCDDLGIKIFSNHVPFQVMVNDIDQVIKDSKVLGVEYIAFPYMENESRPGVDPVKFKETVAKIGEVGAKVRKAGIGMLYHNHDFEFAALPDGTIGHDYIFSSTKPSDVQVELDVCWADFAGFNVVDLVKKYAGRIPVLHMKDYYLEGILSSDPYALIGIAKEDSGESETGKFEFRPLGDGVMDLPAIIEAAKQCGVKWLCVEQDNPTSIAKDAFEGPARSAEYLKKAGLL